MIIKKDDYWKQKLTEDQYRILREKGTEAAFTGKYNKHYEKGMYKCAACGTELFSSNAKYDSRSGWPSFFEAVDPKKIELKDDDTLGMKRIEVVCANCGGHLGHVFDDGPTMMNGKPCTGKRYCINSAALDFGTSK